MAGCLLIQRTHGQFPAPTWWQLSGTPAPEDPAPFHGLLKCCVYMLHRKVRRQSIQYTEMYTHVHKVKRKISISKIKNKWWQHECPSWRDMKDYNTTTGVAEADASLWVTGQSGLHSKTCLQTYKQIHSEHDHQAGISTNQLASELSDISL